MFTEQEQELLHLVVAKAKHETRKQMTQVGQDLRITEVLIEQYSRLDQIQSKLGNVLLEQDELWQAELQSAYNKYDNRSK